MSTPRAGSRLSHRAAGARRFHHWPTARWGAVHWAIAGVLLTFVWRIANVVPILMTLQVTSIASLAAIGLFVSGGGLARLPHLGKNPVYRTALLLLVLMVLSVPFGVYPGHSFRFITQDFIKTFLAFTILAGVIRSLPILRGMIAIFVAGGLVYCLKILTTFQMSGGRLHGLIYYDSNDLGMLLVSSLPLALYLLRSRAVHPAIRLMAGITAGVFLVTFIQTGSRGAFLGMIAVLGATLWAWKTVSVARRLALATTVVLVVSAIAPSGYWDMMSTLLKPTEDYNWSGNSTAGRMEVWKRGLGYMVDRPLLGVGADAFFTAEGVLSAEGRARRARGIGMKWSAPHNSFVQAGAELGVVGLAAFLALLWHAFSGMLVLSRQTPRAPPELLSDDDRALGEALAVAVVGYATTAFFLTMAYSAFLFALLGLIVGYAELLKERERAYLRAAGTSAKRAGPTPVHVAGPPKGYALHR